MWGIRLAALGLLVVGCSSSEEPAPTPPELVDLVKMTSGLHVSWLNKEPSCDSIEIERQAAAPAGQISAPFAVVYTVPGEVDNKHDGSIAAGSVYTYRLRCKKADRYSAYSNELSASP
jgi:hypothetical protein